MTRRTYVFVPFFLAGLITIPAAAGLRLRALLLAYLLTGRRRSEVLNLRWRDLDLEDGFYRYTGKGGKERQRALPPPVRLAIRAYAERAGLGRKVTCPQGRLPGSFSSTGHYLSPASAGLQRAQPTMAARRAQCRESQQQGRCH